MSLSFPLGPILSGARVRVQLAQTPRRYLCHGWQSWSLSAWLPAAQPPPLSRPRLLHPLHTDPRYAQLAHHHGSYYGAVENLDGSVLFLGALGLESHVELIGDALHGSYESGSGDWLCAVGDEREILAFYATMLAQRFGTGRVKKAPRVWCSWYSLYTRISEAQLVDISAAQKSLPFDVFQIDDGWQKDIGDWQANEKFPAGMGALASRIKTDGRRAGLWLAPLIVTQSSTMFRDHADWLLRDEGGALVSAGINWSQPLYALDTSRPEVLAWLANLMKEVRGWGYDYVKLDFLYAGALPGVRHHEMPREAAYRRALQTLRDALNDAYLLTCGAPILPSLGLCDGLRVGPDVAGHFESKLESELLHNFATPGVRNALRTSLHRLWLRPLVHTDPDVVYFSRSKNALTDDERWLLQMLARITGFRATSELPSQLDDAEIQALRELFTNEQEFDPKIDQEIGQERRQEIRQEIRQLSSTLFRVDGKTVDYSYSAELPPTLSLRREMLSRGVGALANIPWVMRLFQSLMGRLTDFRFSE